MVILNFNTFFPNFSYFSLFFSCFFLLFPYWEFLCPHLSLSFPLSCWCGEDLHPRGTGKTLWGCSAWIREGSGETSSQMGDPPLEYFPCPLEFFPVDTGTRTLPSKHSPVVASQISWEAEPEPFGKIHFLNLRAFSVLFCSVWWGPNTTI